MRPARSSPAADDAPLLEVKNLSIVYKTRLAEVPAVADVSFELRPGESLGLVGESGCGKSTLALALMAYLADNAAILGGSIRFRGTDLATIGAEELRRLRGSAIAMIFQEPGSALNPSMRIGEQIAEAAIFHERISRTAAMSRAAEMLSDVGLSDVKRILRSYPHQLSGGQQQRAIIAMALLGRPALLLLDEPTTNLDVTVEAGVVELVARLRKRRDMALIYISHDLGLIAQVCDRVAVMYAGEIVEEGSVEDVFGEPRHPYTMGLLHCIPSLQGDKRTRPLRPIRGQVPDWRSRPGGCCFAPRCDHALPDPCERTHPVIAATAQNGGHRVRCPRWSEIRDGEVLPAGREFAAAGREEILLNVRDLDKYYPVSEGGLASFLGRGTRRFVKANQKINFRLRRRQTLAVVGESGCGKSTLARVLLGLERPTSGSIEYAGIDLAVLPVERRTSEQRRALQIVFQNPDETLNPCYSVGAQIGRVIKKFRVARSPRKVALEVSRMLRLTNLPAVIAQRRPQHLSGGQKQRVAIARAFAGRPSTVIADEPVSSLDVSVRAAITELLIDIQQSEGTTLLVISHDLGLVRYIADRVLVMYLGRVMESGTTAEVFSAPHHPYTEALLSAIPSADLTARRRRIVLQGEIPSALTPPSGCPFHTRCHRKVGRICETVPPPEQRLAEGSHRIVCHIPARELADVQGRREA